VLNQRGAVSPSTSRHDRYWENLSDEGTPWIIDQLAQRPSKSAYLILYSGIQRQRASSMRCSIQTRRAALERTKRLRAHVVHNLRGAERRRTLRDNHNHNINSSSSRRHRRNDRAPRGGLVGLAPTGTSASSASSPMLCSEAINKSQNFCDARNLTRGHSSRAK
jgi:hypothetical protein